MINLGATKNKLFLRMGIYYLKPMMARYFLLCFYPCRKEPWTIIASSPIANHHLPFTDFMRFIFIPSQCFFIHLLWWWHCFSWEYIRLGLMNCLWLAGVLTLVSSISVCRVYEGTTGDHSSRELLTRSLLSVHMTLTHKPQLNRRLSSYSIRYYSSNPLPII